RRDQLLRRVTVSVPRTSPAVVMTPLTSMIVSAGMFARLAASRIASALDASYKQYVFLLSALRNEKSHCTPTSVLMRVTAIAPSGVTSICLAKFRSIMNKGIENLLALRNVKDEIRSASCDPLNKRLHAYLTGDSQRLVQEV